MVQKSMTLNDILVGNSSNPTPLGLVVAMGPGLYMLWAAFACSFASVVPYMITSVKICMALLSKTDFPLDRCCTYR